MKKKEIQQSLEKMANWFADDCEAVAAIALLKNKVAKLPDDKKSKIISEDDLKLPEELNGLTEGFAIFSDGACRGNPGPGAYALIVQNEKGEIILKSSGVEMPTTNNKMELSGVIRGLQGLYEKFMEDGFSKSDVPVFVYSDSKYVIDGITSWVTGWKSRGWKKADNKEPENLELWKELDSLKSGFKEIKFIWVKGHAGHPQNEMCDKLCNDALDEAGF